ncbi:coiled-coil domain-containing protein 186 [Musca domestica]|uniref:Coiled-coil domain-containing protein 186 n=1 Tax=Musca domestica TaxID=7370 RepID=A0A1I8NHE9_MUSDO|nr:coiled-coil domain-containing protein 186 [Musca domestica]
MEESSENTKPVTTIQNQNLHLVELHSIDNESTTTINNNSNPQSTQAPIDVVEEKAKGDNSDQVGSHTDVEIVTMPSSPINAIEIETKSENASKTENNMEDIQSITENAASDINSNEGKEGEFLYTCTNVTTSPSKANDVESVTKSDTAKASFSTPNSPSSSIRYMDLVEKAADIIEVHQQQQPSTEELTKLKEYEAKLQQQQQQLDQLQAALTQKDNMISLFQRENAILEKEKESFRREKDLANKARESTVIQFAIKEKSVIDAKKEKEVVEKQLADAKKEIKNYTTKFQALNEEKSRIAYLMDEKCNEVRKYQRECEKLKTDYGHLESKLKYHMNKLNMETEAKLALEKKLEEERNAPNKMEEKANEKLKIEFEAQTILLKHEIASKTEHLDKLQKETESQKETIRQLQEQLKQETQEKSQLSEAYNHLQEEHNQIQNSYSEEMLQSAKLRGQLEELQVLKTQNTLNEEKIANLSSELGDAKQRLADNEQDLKLLHDREKELLSFNMEMSGSIVDLQNQICLLKSKAQGIEAENMLLKKEKSAYDEKYLALEQQLKQEQLQKNEERLLLAKHLSEKTKLYENTKLKLENVQGDFEATKNKHNTIVKELQREIMKLKKTPDQQGDAPRTYICSRCEQTTSQNNGYHKSATDERLNAETKRSHSRQSSISTTVQSVSSTAGSRRGSESSESDTVTGRELDFKDENKGPSKKHLVERILRLQQASARQAEKIDFLEQHSLSLVAELQKKSKVVQHYMLREQAGALTSSKSDQNKSELAKYGNGVMSAIYGGIKGVENKSMSLELSLEINKKLQAVLEDTLLKNITLKENLDVLGLEVDNLTRKLRQMESKR